MLRIIQLYKILTMLMQILKRRSLSSKPRVAVTYQSCLGRFLKTPLDTTSSGSSIAMRETIWRVAVWLRYGLVEQGNDLCFSVHLLHAGLLCVSEREDAVLQMQEYCEGFSFHISGGVYIEVIKRISYKN